MKRIAALLILSVFLALATPAQAGDDLRAPTTTSIPGGVTLYTWTGLDGDDTGIPVNVAGCRELTAHVYSSAYGGSTITLEGSNDPLAGGSGYASAEWAGLADNSGTAISKSADAIEEVTEKPWFFRPKTASGTGATIAVGLLCKK